MVTVTPTMKREVHLSLAAADVWPVVWDVIRWAGPLVEYEPVSGLVVSCLRSAELAAKAAAAFPEQSSSNLEAARIEVDRFVQGRASLVSFGQKKSSFTLEDAGRELARPQSLLLFRPELSLFDGAAAVVTERFFDDEYFSPWDTWLRVTPCNGGRSLGLLSWVPRWAASRADDAMLASPTECLCWVRVADNTLEHWCPEEF